MKPPFLQAIKERVLVLDGAMGTMLQERGLRPGQSPEELNLTMPDVVAGVHREYLEAGADIIVTNTFGGTRPKLEHYGLEAKVREQFLLEADEAIYTRRNAAVEQERSIKENELNTEIAVEQKKRQIRETKLEADRAVQEKRQAMEQEGMQGNITLEEQRTELVELAVQNRRIEADAQAYGINAALEAFKTVDPKVLQALASIGMDPAQMIAGAFQNLADNAAKIGNLNIAPELLQELIKGRQPQA